uniref:Uncharacterized protein n=1 Tax=Knipowitschia caucasica TaxID=637954 RepID=A0AAV2J1I2_KNICA
MGGGGGGGWVRGGGGGGGGEGREGDWESGVGRVCGGGRRGECPGGSAELPVEVQGVRQGVRRRVGWELREVRR